MTEFKKRFSEYSNEDLLKILKNSDKYQTAAIETAQEIIKNRNLSDIQLKTAEQNIKNEHVENTNNDALKNAISKIKQSNSLIHIENTTLIVGEFFRNLLVTFMLILIISFLPMVIEGGIEGYIWGLIFKGVPFFIISFLNSLVFLILDLLDKKKNAKLSFLPTLFLFGYLFIVLLKREINYGTTIFVLGILIAVFVSNYLRFRKIESK